VEPVDEMRDQLSALLPEVLTLDSAAQHVELESGCADLVTCAQSFHWFANDEALEEIARMLKPDHFLILVWNQRDTSNPVQHKLEEILDRYQDSAIPHSPSRRWQPVINGSALYELVDEVRFTHVHELARELVQDRLRSMSVFSTLSGEVQEATLAEVDAVVPDEQTIALPYYNEAYAYRLVL
jgi:SAM-dependent methyltransferase